MNFLDHNLASRYYQIYSESSETPHLSNTNLIVNIADYEEIPRSDFTDGALSLDECAYKTGDSTFFIIRFPPIPRTLVYHYKSDTALPNITNIKQHRLDGPAVHQYGSTDIDIYGTAFVIDGKYMDAQSYWKDPRVILYNKLKNIASGDEIDSAIDILNL
jgi:hypothetical protein